MIDKLWFHLNQAIGENPVPVDSSYHHNVRSQIFCRNQEEHDYLSALNLMHGRDIEINIWDEWRAINRSLREGGIHPNRVLPFAYTTWFCNLKGS